jgi:hypothetical protein
MPSAGTRPGHKRSIGRRCSQHRAPLLMADAMQRVFIFAMAMWLGGLTAANAQTATQPPAPQIGQPLPQAGVAPTTMDNSSSLTMSTQSGSTGATPSLDATSSALSATASDPLGVPTSTLPSASQTTTGSVAIGAISASPTINPQRAVQLPGEAANTSTQTPTTSTSSAASGGAAAGTSSNAHAPPSPPRRAHPALAVCSAPARSAVAEAATSPQRPLPPGIRYGRRCGVDHAARAQRRHPRDRRGSTNPGSNL